MAVPVKLLGDDEYVVVHVRTHWKALALPAILLVLMAALASFVIAVMPDFPYRDQARWVVIGVAVLVGLAWVIWPFLSWLTSTYTVTNRRLLTRHGVLTRTGRDIPLTRVNDVSHERDLLDRMLGCGTLVIWSAGEQGKVVLHDVPRVQTIQRQVSELLFPPDQPDDEDPPRRR